MDIIKVELKKVENEVLKVAVKEQLREAYQASDEDLEYVQEEFSTFCKKEGSPGYNEQANIRSCQIRIPFSRQFS